MKEPPPVGEGEATPADADQEAGDEYEAEVDEIGDESFPASDAPQWWSGPPDERS
jgi:hypothetical protein